MAFENPSFDPLARLEAPMEKRAPAPSPETPAPDFRAARAPDYGSGNVRFDAQLRESGLPEAECRNYARIFASLAASPDRQAELVERWDEILPKLAEASHLRSEGRAALAADYVRAMREKFDELRLRAQAQSAAQERAAASLAAGVAAFDASRASQAQAAQLAKIRGLAAGPASQAPAPDPLAALA